MTVELLAQADRLNQMQQSVRQQFQEGGSVLGVVAALLVVAAVLWFAWFWSRRNERLRRPGADLDAAGVFAETLRRLNLRAEQKQLLHQAARVADLDHPTVLLLSPHLFDRYIGPCASRKSVGAPSANPIDEGQSVSSNPLVSELRAYLFPADSGA